MSKRKPLTIAVDGPAGAGKSTASRDMARALGYRHIDTGAMYRAAAVGALDQGLPLENEAALTAAVHRLRFEFLPNARVRLNGRDVTDRLRTPEAGQAASRLSAHPAVRRVLVNRQKRLARGGGVVMEGRDIGTVVLPRADVKFFLDASVEERGRRRWRELRAAGRPASLAHITQDIRERDLRDRTRAASPLRPARDAVLVDTTRLSRPRVKRLLLDWIQRKTRGQSPHRPPP